MWKVAVIDDDDSIRALLGRVLQKKFGCIVFEAVNGLDGIALLKKEKPDLTFLDITMPVMNGLEALQLLRKEEDTRALPVFILSSVNDKHVIAHLLSIGITGYMLKPLEVQHVIERLTKFFSGIKKHTHATLTKTASSNDKEAVLVVDSDMRFRSVLHVLYKNDYSLYETESGIDALSLILQTSVKNVIIGEKIQIMNPLTLAQKIRNASKNPLRIYLTAEQPEKFDAAKLPFDGILKKSYIPELVKREFTAKIFGRPDIRFALVSILSQKLREELKSELLSAMTEAFGDTVLESPVFAVEESLMITSRLQVIDTSIRLYLNIIAETNGADPIKKAGLKQKCTEALSIMSLDISTYLLGLSIQCGEPEIIQETPQSPVLMEISFSTAEYGAVQLNIRLV